MVAADSRVLVVGVAVAQIAVGEVFVAAAGVLLPLVVRRLSSLMPLRQKKLLLGIMSEQMPPLHQVDGTRPTPQ